MKLRSLFLALAGALLFTAALAPRANAELIVYFNFEHPPSPNPTLDFDHDSANLGAPDFNPGGGIQASTLTLVTTADFRTAGGLLLNRTALDSDPAPPFPPSFNGQALLLNDTKNTTAELCFTVDTSFLTNLSLTFATDNNGNGYSTVQLSASINGGAFFNIGSSQTMGLGVSLMTFNIGDGGGNFLGTGTPQTTVFCLTFTGGQSNGNDRQTVIDNIQLNAAIVPEPATVGGGLLGVLGICWHQRRRLIRSLRLRPA
jgi:hypothetical protein